MALVLVVGAGLMVGCAGSKATSNGGAASRAAQQSQNGADDNGIKPFGDVIPEDATTDAGLLTTHRVSDKLFVEIPDSLIGRELLMVSRAAQTPDGFGYGGEKVNTQVLRWQRRDDQMYLRVVSHENMADEDEPVYRAVQNSNLEPIIKAFSVEALNEDSTGVVVEATDLFTSDVPSLGIPNGARQQYQVRRLDGDRTFITGVESFPENTDVEVMLTYQAKNPPSNSSTGTLTVEMNHSMVLLPKEPMQPRLCDDRVGYFSVERVNFSSDEQRAAEECFITRWNLEPKDPDAYRNGELVEPKEPIVYYIDPATPEKWRPYLKQGVEDWQEAFRQAGFKNAIIAKDPPTAEEDSTFDPDDIRYSTIRYFASEVQNAYGPHVHDPRSGQILESDIGWYHNVMNLLRNWYFIQTAAVNPEARGRVLSTEVMGELIRFVAAHEVGHTLGLPHNMGSSNAVPVDSLRSPSYMEEHGTAPSIMDYARFNYVAQPGDGVETFMPKIGIYDKWSIQWGYTKRPQGTPEEQAQRLDAMILEHADDPRYFFGASGSIDPRSQTEDLGRDAMAASRLGMENLKRILPNLVEWTSEDGKDYQTLEELYGAVVNQWQRYMGHVSRHIGGVHETPKTYEQDGPVYEPVPAEDQKRAMDFLVQHAFQTPLWMVEAPVLRRIEHAGALNRVREAQVRVLERVLDPQRMARVLETEAMADSEVYTLGAVFSDLREGLWTELDDGEAIDPFRRNLQRGYLEHMDHLMEAEVEAPPPQWREFIDFTPVDVAQSDIRAYVRHELQTLRDEVERARRRVGDERTQMHLDDVLARITRILNPNGQDA
jgi:hypothetical protein